jgi:type IV pilus assembly protein PilA
MAHKRRIRSRRSRRGYTLVELLTVMLILGVLMDVALPLYLNVLDDSKKKVCRSNMETIANAVQASHVKLRTANYTPLIAAGVTTANLPDLTSIPQCPYGGIYSLANGSSGSGSTFQVSCSIVAHGKYEPGVDSH